MGGLGKKALIGSIWSTVDKFGSMIVQFLVNLVMARILSPQDFGLIGLLTVFIIVSQLLIDGGFGSALIQKRELTQMHYSTIFWWNLVFSVVLYGVLFVSAPFIADFFRLPILIDILRVIGLVVVFNGLIVVQNSRLRRGLKFNQIAIANIVTFTTGGAVGILCATNGFGVWSLVAMQLTNSIILTVLLWVISKWHPSFEFSIDCFKQLFSFGGYMLLANVLQEICRNFQSIIIGRKFSTDQMGYYGMAYRLDYVSSSALSVVIGQVMYPVFSKIQFDDKMLKDTLAMNVRVISHIVFPFIAFLILISPQLIIFLYGPKWQISVTYFRILSVGGIFVCLQNVNFYAVAAKGYSKTLFYWSFYKWGCLLALLLTGMHWGMNGIMWAIVISSINIWCVNALLSQRYVGFRFIDQLRSLLPMMCVSFVSLGLLFFMMYYGIISFISASVIFILANLIVPVVLRFRSWYDLRDAANKFLS